MMSLSQAIAARCIITAAFVVGLCVETGRAQQPGEIVPTAPSATLSAKTQAIVGHVRDEQGRAIVGATVTITDPQQSAHAIRSDMEGKYAFAGLAPGTYAIRISAANFTPYENRTIKVAPGQGRVVNVVLRIQLRKEEITVLSGNPLIRGAEYGGCKLTFSRVALRCPHCGRFCSVVNP